MMLAHGLQTALYGMLFWAIIAVLGFSLLALWQVCASRPAKPSAVVVAAVTLVAAIPLLLLAMLATFTDDPSVSRFFVYSMAAAAWLALLADCASLGLWLFRRKV